MAVVAPAILAARPDATVIHDQGRRRRVAVDTFVRVLWVHALAADDATGRGIRITTAQAAAAAGCSERTVQHSRAIARELGLLVDVVHGRQLTLDERLEAYERGSKQRGLANESALTTPSWLVPYLLPYEDAYGRSSARKSRPQRPRRAAAAAAELDPVADPGVDDSAARESFSVERCTPPPRPPGSTQRFPTCLASTFTPQAATAASPASKAGTQPRSASTPSQRSRRVGLRLARELTARLPWLRATTRPGRIAPMLARFEQGGTLTWTAKDIIAAIDAVNVRMGWTSVTSQHVRTNGHAVLAYYVRHLDVDADHPRLGQVLAAEQRREAQARRRVELKQARAQRVDPPTALIAQIRRELRNP